MDVTGVYQLLLHSNQLKRTARTGWVQRGIANAEDVAAHSYGVVMATLVLAPMIEEPIDLGRALAMAALHDLPEGLTTDIPTPAWRYMPEGVKTAVERGAMQEITQNTPVANSFMKIWEELHANETAVAKLVHDADKIDMFLQAIIYEEQTGNQHLSQFWQKERLFNFPIAQALYGLLRKKHLEMNGR